MSMTDRERFLACLLGESVDRAPFWIYFGPWTTAWQRWEREGKPAHIHDHRTFIDTDQPPLAVPVNCGPCPAIAPTTIHEDDESFTWTDGWGIVRRNLKGCEGMSEFLRFPVRDRADWEHFKAERLDPDAPERLAGDWRQQCAGWTAQGYPIQLGSFPDVGIFGGLRWLLGDEECLMAFYTMPNLVHDIMEHLTSVYLTVFEKVAREVRVDVVHLWEDMCGRQGPLISPRHWDEFMAPQYQRIRDFTERHGIPLISVDTDGDPDLIIPCMRRVGVNYLFPLEVAAGCDVNAVQRKYPRLGLMGGIDKRALAVGPEAIDRELERIRPALKKGGYIPSPDHLIPDDVSWDNYFYFAHALKRLVGKE